MGHVRQIGIVTGLAIEARALRRAVRLESLEDRIVIAPTGGDRQRIAELAREFAAHGADTFFSMGLAGALSDTLKTQSCLVPDKVIFADGRDYPTEAKLGALITACLEPDTAVVGDLLCVEREVADPEEKRRLFAATGAVAIDMESGHLAQAAAEAGIDFAVLRIILDEAGNSLPPSVLGLMRPSGTIDQTRLIKNIAKRPADLPPLVGLMMDSIGALNRLSRVARLVFRQLF